MNRLFAIAISFAAAAAWSAGDAMACPAGYYTNVDGYCVLRPTYPPPTYAPPPPYYPPSTYAPAPSYTAPDMPTAQCADGTYSYSQHRGGTCSHHGGIRY